MALEVLNILAIVSLTIIFGVVGLKIFDRTKIPDVIWLLLFGMLVGPVFHLVDTGIFLAVSPLFAAVALTFILFDAGMEIDLVQMFKQFPRGMLMTILTVLTSIIVIGYISQFIFNISMLEGMLIGVIVSDTSSPIVMAMLKRIRVSEETKALLALESTLTDPIIIILAIAIINMLMFGASADNIFQSITSSFSEGAIIGFAAGIAWAFILDRIKGSGYDYILTIAVMLLTYVTVESLSGSGPVAALLFGLVFANSKKIMGLFKMKIGTDGMVKKFHAEITFFIQSFFFVYLGLIFSINTAYILGGIAIIAIILALRYLIVDLTTYKMGIPRSEVNLIKVMASRVLSAAIVAQLPLAFGLPNANMFLNVGFVVIFGTIIFSVVAVRTLLHQKKDFDIPGKSAIQKMSVKTADQSKM
jgi:cell volume regulation protein A